jgi:hypothetical protein
MDDDADGVDDVDDDCPTDSGEQIDTDGDGFCDNQDSDDDNDGVYDYNDDMPLDGNETTDNDGDGIGDNADDDDDNDGCPDDQDDLPLDDSDCVDTDGDGLGNDVDPDDDGDGVMDENDPFPLDGTAWADNDGDGIPDFNGDPPFMGNFEGGGIPSGWTTFGNAEWLVQSNTVINGSFSAQSGDISDAQTSSLELSYDTNAGPYSFAYLTDSEANWDYLRFYLDGSLVNSWSGSGTSGTQSGTLTAGYHTFEWMYYKDSSVSSYTDTVWIDDVTLPISQTWANNDTDDDNDGVMDEYDMDPNDPCVSADTDGDGAPDWVVSGPVDMNNDSVDDVDCDASGWYEDWDDDGDGWSDIEELLCGSDNLDASDIPIDMDYDWLCDALDDDLDNDGVPNPIDCNAYWFSDWTVDDFEDCLVDTFNAADSSDDGEVDWAELFINFGGVLDDGDEGHYFICHDTNGTEIEIPFELVNDGMADCPNGEDEPQDWMGGGENGTEPDGVTDNWFDCEDGTNISMDLVNDGFDDCSYGEDEAHEDDGSDDDGISAEEFNDTWSYVLMWDADSNDAISFDEFWELNNDTGIFGLMPVGAENPGWPGEDTVWDMFPFDGSEAYDSDGDGIGDNADNDDDNDGVPDSLDEFPFDSTEWEDMDGDGVGDNSDNDTDGDGIPNDVDQFDTDPDASSDNDGDGADDESDTDDDNDGVPDVSDWAPNDASEWADNDGDGIGDNADPDDDNDGEADFEDAFPLDATETADADGDGLGDGSDPDDDNDGVPDGLDAFPMDPNESRDLDGDGIGDNADSDMDEDGVSNSDDAFPQNSAEWDDTDGDNIGDNSDPDQDGDGDLNADDPWPLDSTEWDDTDNDGIGDNTDTDDDGDGYTDSDEAACGTDSKRASSTPSDFDGDGDCDAIDTSDSRSEAAKGENAQPELGFTPGFPSVLAAISLLGAAMLGRRKDD